MGHVQKDLSMGWKSPVRIGIVGGLRRWKGQHVFLEAAADILDRGHNARFVIVGGPLFAEEAYEAELHALAKSLHIDGRVEFLGFRADVDAILRDLDILVHASISSDPCPNVVLEGMAAGLPIVGSNGGGVPEMLGGDSGLLVPMGDAKALAQAIDRLLSDPPSAAVMGDRAFRRVRSEFTSTRTADGVLRVYESLASARR